MILSEQAIYIAKAVEIVRKRLAEKGIILFHIEGLEQAVLEVGKLYYEMEKRDEII